MFSERLVFSSQQILLLNKAFNRQFKCVCFNIYISTTMKGCTRHTLIKIYYYGVTLVEEFNYNYHFNWIIYICKVSILSDLDFIIMSSKLQRYYVFVLRQYFVQHLYMKWFEHVCYQVWIILVSWFADMQNPVYTSYKDVQNKMTLFSLQLIKYYYFHRITNLWHKHNPFIAHHMGEQCRVNVRTPWQNS